jgi:hypothetical protein
MILMTVDLAPIWQALKPLLTEHGFLTILCGFLAVMMTISFYRFLRSVNPGLVGFVLLMVLFLLVLHWSQTRNEPAFLKPAMDWVVQYIPSAAPVYKH